MSVVQKKTLPHLVHQIFHLINQNGISSNDLIKAIQKSMKIKVNEAKELIENMVFDGFLLDGKKMIYKVPLKLDELIEPIQRDWYCYECHKPGEQLIECAQCDRVFHIYCIRDDINTPIIPLKEPVPAFIKNLLQQTNGAPSSSPSINGTGTPTIVDEEGDGNVKLLDSSTATKFAINNELNSSNDDSKEEINVVDGLTISPISNDGEQRTANEQYCICCRIKNSPKFMLPPNTSLNEINALISFSFDRIKTWIPSNTFAPQEPKSPKISSSNLKLLKNILLYKCVTRKTISEKLDTKKYNTLAEFYCDIMDILHCIGIIRGCESSEYEACKYLVIDALCEITEIAMCKDCFRHSNNQEPMWFAKPCSVSHELVYAKQKGYCYWPAKVLKIKDNNYDVRFFGGKHERAFVNATNVKPIDTERKVLKLSMSSALKKSLEELKKYQENLSVDLHNFSFEAECKQEMENTLAATNSTISTEDSNAINSSSTPSSSKSYESRDLIQQRNQSKPLRSKPTMVANKMNAGRIGRKRKLVDDINEEEDNNNVLLKYNGMKPVVKRLKNEDIHIIQLRNKLESATTVEECTQLALDALSNQSREHQIEAELLLDAHKNEIEEIKKKPWCVNCHEESMYYCCWYTSYCSTKCQADHWKLEHKVRCKRLKNKQQ